MPLLAAVRDSASVIRSKLNELKLSLLARGGQESSISEERVESVPSMSGGPAAPALFLPQLPLGVMDALY